MSAPSTRRQRGFTLIEALVALSVSAILTSTAMPSMQRWLDARRVDGFAAQLAADLQFARLEAVSRNTPVRVSVHAMADNTSCYVIHTGTPAQCPCSSSGRTPCTDGAESLKTVVLAAHERVEVSANVPSLLFDPLHGTSSPAGSLQVTSALGRSVRHVVNIMGRVRSCSPDASVGGYRAC